MGPNEPVRRHARNPHWRAQCARGKRSDVIRELVSEAIAARMIENGEATKRKK
jgi:hypothetical protein